MEPGSPYVPTLDDYVDVPRVDSIKTFDDDPLPPKMSVSSLLMQQSSVLSETSTQTPQQRMTVERPSSRTERSGAVRRGELSAGVPSTGTIPRRAEGHGLPTPGRSDAMRHSQGPYRKPVPRRKYTSPRAREKEERMHRRRQRIDMGRSVLDGCDLPNAERNYQLCVEALSQEPKSTNRIESLLDKAEVAQQSMSTTLGALSFATDNGESSLSASRSTASGPTPNF